MLIHTDQHYLLFFHNSIFIASNFAKSRNMLSRKKLQLFPGIWNYTLKVNSLKRNMFQKTAIKKRTNNVNFSSLTVKYIAKSQLSKETKGPTNKARSTINLLISLPKKVLLSIYYIPTKIWYSQVSPIIWVYKVPYNKMFQSA